jgi:uncharacterized protein
MKRNLVLIFLFVGLSLTAFSEIPERPNPPRLVNDFAGVLTSNERNQLERDLEQFARETSTQIVVVTVADLEGYDPGDYSFRLGEKWGVGQKSKDNGVVILLKPKQGNSKGQVFVATGYGLEAVLPDAIVNSVVVNNEMIPYFKENNYYRGLQGGIKVIMDITRGEYTAEQYQEYSQSQNGGVVPGIFFFLFIIFMLSIFRRRRGRFYSPGRSLPFWLAMGMMSGRNSHNGSFGNFSSGSGSFGGFGGFGGGSFGGGGAGGSW